MTTNTDPVFPNYMQMKRRISIPMWQGVRIISLGVVLGIIMALFIRPKIGLKLFWGTIIPFVPLLFFIAPGVWRNLCPMATLNQTPRLFNFTRADTAPEWFREYGYVISIVLFLIIVPNRKTLFNESGIATALLILALLIAAFTMGVFFKGKSGWCSSICPLLPIQRIYGQTPFIKVPNAHCQPCVGCTKNCYDFNPHVAYLADLYDKDQYFSGYRKYFVGLFPGFIIAFYTLPSPPEIGLLSLYAGFAGMMLVSAGSFYLFNTFLKVTDNKITVVYGALALNAYYYFNAITIAGLFTDPPAQAIIIPIRVLVFGLTLVWIVDTYKKETIFIKEAIAPAPTVGSNQSIVAHSSAMVSNPEILFKDNDQRIVCKPGRTLLEVAEANGLPIEPGCRMGVCGADPIAVIEGMENLSAMKGDERGTVERLGLGKHVRMACMARVKGKCTVSLKLDAPKTFETSIVQGFKYDKSVEKVVIVGNGIAGVTAADHVRRRHPKCEIHLIGRESHLLYNRMAITRLIYGRSAMQGLYLLPEKWYKDYKITTWLNTYVQEIDTTKKEIALGTGESLLYDRLILTTGSNSFVPPIENYGLAGSFVLREAADAMSIRQFVQEKRCRHAVIAGGGLLGLEAAYGLHKLGLEVSVLERGDYLLKRQLDARGAQFLREYLEGLGIHIVVEAEAAELSGRRRVESVTLKDGRTLKTDIFLVAAGIRSETSLAQEMGLSVGRGIQVNEKMETSHAGIYAAGDAAEYAGKVMGLWATAVAQAEVAAANAVGANETYSEIVPVTMLKVVGVDLTSIGRFQPESDGETVVALEDISNHTYRKLVIKDNRIVGAILLGHPNDAAGVSEAVKRGVDVSRYMDDLNAGNWDVLNALVD